MASKDKRPQIVFIDDDELPHPGYLQAAIDTFVNNRVDVVGGKINVNFEKKIRPECHD